MRRMIYWTLILTLSGFSVVKSQFLGQSVTYTASVEMGGDNPPMTVEWIYERSISSETLFLFPESNEDQLVTVSNKKLTNREFYEALQTWISRKTDLKYLRLSCSLSDEATGDRSLCFCTTYVKQWLDNDSSSAQFQWTPQTNNVSICNRVPQRLTSRVFNGMTNLSTINFEHVELQGIESDAFVGLPSLQLIRLAAVLMPIDQNAIGLFCGLKGAIFVQISNTAFKTDEESDGGNDILQLLHCVSTNATPEMRTKIFFLEVNDSRIMRLNRDAFIGLDPIYFSSISFARNEITAVDNETFCGFSNVFEIDLSYNRLNSLEFLVSPALASLRSLNLAYNRILVIETSVFEGMVSLRTLNLSGNGIIDIYGGFDSLSILIFLDLQLNNLSTVSEFVLSECTQLVKLWLGGNQIDQIHANAFKGTVFLKFLDLSSNRISNETMVKNFLQFSLERLEILSLRQNRLVKLLPNMFKVSYYNTKLNTIDLTDNQLEIIDKNAFSGQYYLKALLLGGNKLREIYPDSFRTNNKLTSIFCSYNLLEYLPENVLPESVGELRLANNLISKLPLFNKTMPNLSILSLHGNRLSEIGNNALSQFPSLQVLNLSNNSIAEISPMAFNNKTKLNFIDLSQNSLDLDFSINYFDGCFKLQFLNFSRNNIRSARNLFLHHVRYSSLVDLSHNPIFIFPDQPKRTNLYGQHVIVTERLLMKNCSLHTIDPSSLELAFHIGLIDFTDNNLAEFQPLKISNLANDFKYQVLLDNNPIKCSCRMKWLTNESFISHYRVPYCLHTLTGNRQPFKSVLKEEFLCDVTESCVVEAKQCACLAEQTASEPTYLDCSGKAIDAFPKNVPPTTKVIHFEGNALRTLSKDTFSASLRALQKLYLDNNRIVEIKAFAFSSCPDLLILSLSGNKMTHLKHEMFSNLRRLNALFLQGNLIEEIEPNAFQQLHYLNTLTLHDNSLKFLTDDNMEDMSSLYLLNRLSLHENPWSCECDNATFKYWIQQQQNIIENVSDIKCNDTSVLSISDENLLCYSLWQSVTEFQYFAGPLFAVCSLAAIAFVALFLAYRYRYVLQVLIYSRFNIRQNQKENESCIYDAIAIYDSSDALVRGWIKDVLVARLEPKFQLFIPDRDMAVGGAQCNEIVESIKRSRRTILVLSRGAEQQEELLFAFDVANHRVRLQSFHHRMIIVVLGNVDCKHLVREANLNASLKAYLVTNQFIRVTDKLFWEKLNFFLPMKKNITDKTEDTSLNISTVSSRV